MIPSQFERQRMPRRVHSGELSSVGHPYQVRNYDGGHARAKSVRVNELIPAF